MLRIPLSIATALLLAGTAHSAPALRGDIAVTAPVVTLGDMLSDAGAHAETPIFRAPAPGTAGSVTVADIVAAATAAGLGEIDTAGLQAVRVARKGTPIDTALVASLVSAELTRRNVSSPGADLRLSFDREPAITAAAVPEAARIDSFAYDAASGRFSARLAIAGQAEPLIAEGRAELVVELPHLVAALPAGAIVGPADIEMRPVPMRQAEAAAPADAALLIGKQLRRAARAGLVLRATDVIEPLVVSRNAEVTVLLSTGAMTLTMRGKALNEAAAGNPVQVLNPTSRKILHGVARADGTVAIPLATPSQPVSAPARVAGLQDK